MKNDDPTDLANPMQFLPIAIAATATVATLGAQSPLVVAPAGGALLQWPGPSPDHQTFFDLTVHTTITVQALTAPVLGAVGQPGTIELWLTNPGFTTFVGNEQSAARWHLAASGSVTANGATGSTAQLMCTSCQDAGGAGLVLTPGSYGCAVRYGGVGNQFCAVPTSPATASNNEVMIHGGAVQYTAFTSPPAAPGGGYAGWSWFGEFHYALGAVPHACAEAVEFGSGCLARYASIYDWFQTAAAASAFSGRGFSFVPNSSGAYTVLGVAIYPYAPPSPAAMPLPIPNDGESMVALTAPFPHPGGLASNLFVHENGFVSVGPNSTLAGPNWLPNPVVFLGAPATGWWIWHDMNPGEPGSGSIWFEEDPGSGLVYITWLDVESYPNGVANPSTFQMVFHPATGIVTMNVVALDPIGGATTGDRWLVGYSPGGASADPGRTDLAALATGPGQTVFLPPAEIAALELRASGRPLLGSTVVLTTGNQTGGGFGFALLATAPAQPALDLATMGAPGCSAWVDPASSATVLLSNLGAPGLGMNVALPIPNDTGLLGVHIYGQSAWLDSTANALGVITSNGVRLELGSY